MDLSKLSTGDKLVAGAALALFVSLFFPWFGVDFEGAGGFSASASASGYDAGGFLFAILPLLLALVMVGQIALARLAPQTKLPEPPLPWGQVHLIAGGVALALVLLKFLIGEDGEDVVDIGRKWGIFVSLLAVIALAAGGFLKKREDGATTGATGSSGPRTVGNAGGGTPAG